jgi:hypothetical protein
MPTGWIALSIVATASCTGLIDGGGPPAPVLLAVSTDTISIGQPLDVYGGNFLNDTGDAHTELRFQGQFQGSSGQTYAVDYRFEPLWSDGNHVVWPFVGPYSNPFSSPTGDQLGTFTGTVVAYNVTGKDKTNREESPSGPIPVTLKFGPSLIIKDLQPLDAMCDEPAKRVLGGFNYKISVEADGFTPVNFSYIIAGEPGVNSARVYRQIAQGQTDSFGANGELTFEPVPDDGTPFYLVDFAVTSLDTDGNEHQMQLTIGVHRPIEYIDSGIPTIAQIEQAAPDSGCLSGGDTNGVTVTYTQTHIDTRTRQVGITWDETWLNSVSNMQGGSHTTTNSVNWQVTHTDMQGWTFGWDAGLMSTQMGDVGIPFLAQGSVSVTESGGIHHDHTWGYSDSRSVGGDHSEADTESWATTSTTSHSVAKGGQDFWTVSSSDQKSLAFTGLILPHRFGVFYRQTTRIAIAGSVVAYNLCGTPEVVANADFFDYQWSLDLAQGDTCSPLPATHLPPAQCIMSPCGN